MSRGFTIASVDIYNVIKWILSDLSERNKAEETDHQTRTQLQAR